MSNFPVFQAKAPVQREVGFVVSGTYADDHDQAGDEWTETFRCVPELPAVMITEGRLAFRVVDGKAMVQAGPASRFIASAVVQSEQDRFSQLVHDPNRLIDAELIGDIFDHLWGVYADRPIPPANASGNGRSNRKASSAAD